MRIAANDGSKDYLRLSDRFAVQGLIAVRRGFDTNMP